MIFLVALIVFGPRRLPEIGKSLGKALGEFRRATNDLKSTLEEEVRADDMKRITPPPADVAAATPAAPAAPVGTINGTPINRE